MKFEKTYIKEEFTKLTCLFAAYLVKDPCQWNWMLTFLFHQHELSKWLFSFHQHQLYVITGMAFMRLSVFNFKINFTNGDLVWAMIMKNSVCCTIDNMVWLITENQIDAWRSYCEYEKLRVSIAGAVNSCGSSKLKSFICCNIMMVSYYRWYFQLHPSADTIEWLCQLKDVIRNILI